MLSSSAHVNTRRRGPVTTGMVFTRRSVMMRVAAAVVSLPLAGLAQAPARQAPPPPMKAAAPGLPPSVLATLSLAGQGVALPATVSASLALQGQGIVLPAAVSGSTP